MKRLDFGASTRSSRAEKTVPISRFDSVALSTITDHVTKKVTNGPIGSTLMIQLKMETSKIDRLCLMNKRVLIPLVSKLVQGSTLNIFIFEILSKNARSFTSKKRPFALIYFLRSSGSTAVTHLDLYHGFWCLNDEQPDEDCADHEVIN